MKPAIRWSSSAIKVNKPVRQLVQGFAIVMWISQVENKNRIFARPAHNSQILGSISPTQQKPANVMISTMRT